MLSLFINLVLVLPSIFISHPFFPSCPDGLVLLASARSVAQCELIPCCQPHKHPESYSPPEPAWKLLAPSVVGAAREPWAGDQYHHCLPSVFLLSADSNLILSSLFSWVLFRLWEALGLFSVWLQPVETAKELSFTCLCLQLLFHPACQTALEPKE